MKGARAHLALADGTVFPGRLFGAPTNGQGEVVFTTGLTGYEEVLTDPSYTGQIVIMTTPHIGNTGITLEDTESVDGTPKVAGFVVRDLSPTVSNWRSKETLDAHLTRHGISAISDVDTRLLTRHIRDHGAQNGTIGTESPDILVDRARAAASMVGLDLVSRVTPPAPYPFQESTGTWNAGVFLPGSTTSGSTSLPHIVVIDYGIKRNILRCLVDSGFRVTAVPAHYSAHQILAQNPDGIFLSNGPGDPAAVPYAVKTIRELLGKRPIFGICLGHQMLALALGGSTYKLKFGHRGLNQPVKDLQTGRVEITTQNHGFAVQAESLAKLATTTHIHLNDGTNEGIEIQDLNAFSVQYHPEAAAGPHDALYLFKRFRKLVTG